MLPWARRTYSPFELWAHTSFAAPLHEYRMTALPLPPLALSCMHMLPCLSSPPLNDHDWARSLLLHFQTRILVRRAELLPESSAHMPAYPLI